MIVRLTFALLPLFLICVPQHPALASNQTAKVTGRIVDSEAKTPLAHVQIFVEDLQVGDVSDDQGVFEIPNLPPGEYRLVFRLQGYKTHESENVRLLERQVARLNVAMAPEVIELSNLVVTATRHPDRTSDLSQMISVLTPKEIRQRNVQQTPELLREEPGVVVQKTNQGGGSPILRGLKANKVLLLVDGVRMNNATYRGGNTQYLNTVDSQTLEGVEIVHGPGSVLYGSDALGGVIHLRTLAPQLNSEAGLALSGAVSASASSADDTQTSNATVSLAWRRLGLRFSGGLRSFGDVTRGAKGGDELMQRLRNDSRTQRILKKNQSPNGYQAYDFSTRAIARLSETSRLALSYQFNHQDEVPRYDVVETRKDSIRLFDPQQRNLVALRYQNFTRRRLADSFSLTASYHRQRERRVRQKFGSVTRTSDEFNTGTLGIQAQLDKSIAGIHQVVYGAELYRDAITTTSLVLNTGTGAFAVAHPLFPDGSTMLNVGAFVQDAMDISERWRVTAGARFSVVRLKAPFVSDPASDNTFGNIEQVSTALTGSLGSLYRLTPRLSVVTNLAQGFRSPNLDDVGKLGPGKGSSFFDIPNPNLDPEKSLNLDTGFKWTSNRSRVDFFGYYNILRDLLARVPAELNGSPFVLDGTDSLRVFHKTNAGEAFTAGFALSSEIALAPRLVAFTNLSYTYGQNETDEQPLSGVPPLSGLAGIRWNTPRYRVELNARFAGKQTRLADEDQEDLRIPEGGTPAWRTFNLRFGAQLHPNLNTNLTIANLFDRNYREHLSGFNAPGRNFVLSARVTY